MLTSMINHAMYVCIQRHSSNVAKLEISISIRLVRFICDLWTYNSKLRYSGRPFSRGCALIMEGTEAPLTPVNGGAGWDEVPRAAACLQPSVVRLRCNAMM